MKKRCKKQEVQKRNEGIKKSFGALVKSKTDVKEVNEKRLAQDIGITINKLRRILNGELELTSKAVKTTADYFHIDLKSFCESSIAVDEDAQVLKVVGEHFRFLIGNANSNISNFSKKTGISRQSLYKVLNGKGVLRYDLTNHLCEELNTSVEEVEKITKMNYKRLLKYCQSSEGKLESEVKKLKSISHHSPVPKGDDLENEAFNEVKSFNQRKELNPRGCHGGVITFDRYGVMQSYKSSDDFDELMKAYDNAVKLEEESNSIKNLSNSLEAFDEVALDLQNYGEVDIEDNTNLSKSDANLEQSFEIKYNDKDALEEKVYTILFDKLINDTNYINSDICKETNLGFGLNFKLVEFTFKGKVNIFYPIVISAESFKENIKVIKMNYYFFMNEFAKKFSKDRLNFTLVIIHEKDETLSDFYEVMADNLYDVNIKTKSYRFKEYFN